VATNGPIVRTACNYEHAEPWWNAINREKRLIRPREFSGNPTSKATWYQAGGTCEGNYEFRLAMYFCTYLQVIIICRKILRHETIGFTSPPKKVVLRISIALKKSVIFSRL
jgi:hypothetical protein